MRAFMDARTVPAGSTLETDLAIIGGGPTGIALALALANTPIRVLLLESGGMERDEDTQALYKGRETGVPYIPLDAGRLRYFGGSSNHWGGYCRPL
ncbi:MAG TPA: FAD-dependent monooxygenase, partial [Rhizomicrobium sp.]|nr:FAD-dependent monooxygenase [Rhizomicrobium sp.]